MSKLNSAEETIIEQVDKWKADDPAFVTRITHTLSQPLVWAADKFIPDDVKSGMGKVTEGIANQLQNLSEWTVNEAEVIKATKEFEIDAETILELKKASIHDLDHVAEKFMKLNSQIGAAEGFGAGLIGWAGFLADLPALFLLCMRQVYQTSLCYGFGVGDEEHPRNNKEYEIAFALRVFQIATCKDKVEKTKSLLALKDFEMEFNSDVYQNIGHGMAANTVSKTAAIQVSRVLVNEIVKQLLSRWAITRIPGIGAVLTAGFNYMFLDDVGNTAYMLYRERFLLDKKGRKKVVNITVD